MITPDQERFIIRECTNYILDSFNGVKAKHMRLAFENANSQIERIKSVFLKSAEETQSQIDSLRAELASANEVIEKLKNGSNKNICECSECEYHERLVND